MHWSSYFGAKETTKDTIVNLMRVERRVTGGLGLDEFIKGSVSPRIIFVATAPRGQRTDRKSDDGGGGKSESRRKGKKKRALPRGLGQRKKKKLGWVVGKGYAKICQSLLTGHGSCEQMFKKEGELIRSLQCVNVLIIKRRIRG